MNPATQPSCPARPGARAHCARRADGASPAHRGRHTAPRRRGSVYIAVLGAAMIVTTLGVSALYLVRLQGRINDGANNALRAAAAAGSMIEVARIRLANNAGWRTSHTNNTWVADIAFGPGKMTYKLVDERDGNLSNSNTQPVRLHARATFGRAVRLMSVELSPDSTGKLLVTPNSARQEVLP